MADTHEEQLLNELLSSIARDDEGLEAAHLELRVMAALDATPAPRFRASTTHIVVAAAMVTAVLVPAIAWVVRDVPSSAGEVYVQPPQQAIVHTPAATATPSAHAEPTTRAALSQPAGPVKPAPRARAPLSERPATQPTITQSPISHSPISQSPDIFVPLLPMTGQELTGSFQLVRVQMPRASLGALRSPLESPNELVEADVLLGEDGMARAIRVSTSGSIYPWRSR